MWKCNILSKSIVHNILLIVNLDSLFWQFYPTIQIGNKQQLFCVYSPFKQLILAILSNYLDKLLTSTIPIGQFIQTAYFGNSTQPYRHTTNNNYSVWTVHSNSLFWQFHSTIQTYNQQQLFCLDSSFKTAYFGISIQPSKQTINNKSAQTVHLNSLF